jgi:tetratricopeptide (TPR) repeat protein
MPPGAAWAAAGVWALHPMTVASVAWITERKNVLYVFFYLLALLAYARAAACTGRHSAAYWVVSLGCAVLSLLAKATAVTLPGGVFLLHWASGRRFDLRSIVRLASYLGVALAIGLLHIYREEVEAPLGLDTRILLAARAVWFYVTTYFWPRELVAMYPRWPPAAAAAWGIPALFALLGALAVGLVGYRRAPRAAGFGAAHFAGNVCLVIGVIWFPYMRYSFVADHLVYFPSLGLAILATLAGRAALVRLGAPGALRVIVAGAVWLLLAGWTREQTGMWHDTESLWTRALEVNPTATVAHNNLGVALLEAERRDEARAHFETSLRIEPDDATALFNLGVMAAGRKEWAQAIDYYKHALRENVRNPLVWNNLGVVAAEQLQHDKAVVYYRRSLEFDPDDADAHVNLAAALERQGKRDDALDHFEMGARLNPRSVKARYRLGKAHAEAERWEAAQGELEAARAIEPENTEVLSELAAAYSATGRHEDARRHLAAAVGFDPEDASLEYRLGSAILATGSVESAMPHFERSITLLRPEGHGPMLRELARLLYEHGAEQHAIDYYRRACAKLPDDPETAYELGVTLSAAGRHLEAAEAYRRALARAPEHAEATNNLGAALRALGRRDEAAAEFRRALALAPADPETRRNLALVLYEDGRVTEAIVVLEAGIGGAGTGPEIENLLAWVRATASDPERRDPAAAVRLAERACAASDYANPYYLDTLAASYAAAGRFSDAVRLAERALALADASSDFAAEIKDRLALYREERPYRHD